MTTSPTNPNQPTDQLLAELRSLKQEVAELRYDLRKQTTFKLSNEISRGVTRGINTAILPWVPLIFVYLLLSSF